MLWAPRLTDPSEDSYLIWCFGKFTRLAPTSDESGIQSRMCRTGVLLEPL